MSEPTRPKRSRNGCWTCRKRRRKCTEEKPTCKTCQRDGHFCEGYESRLRWNVKVSTHEPSIKTSDSVHNSDLSYNDNQQRRDAAQNKSAALSSSSPISAPLHSSRENAVHQLYSANTPDLGATPGGLRNMQKETLFQEFLTKGLLHLHATTADDSPLLPILPALCRRSDTLYDVCVACQAYLSYGADETFFDFYSEALEKFRAHIYDHPLRETDEAILNAALLMCTIGVLQGTPWTIHITGMQQLLDERAALSPLRETSIAFVQAIEVMGIFDLDIFVIGRQCKRLDVWRRYRQGLLIHSVDEMDAVQSMSGLPHSLIDLLANYRDGLEEEDLWLWPGCEGTFLQCQMWDAYRFAVMLHIRHQTQNTHTTSPMLTPSSISQKELRLPTSKVLLTKALSCIDSVYNGIGKPSAANSLVMNAILLPLFYAALDVFSTNDQDRHEIVRQWYQVLLESYPFANIRQSWEIVQEYARARNDGNVCDIEGIAKKRNIEVALF